MKEAMNQVRNALASLELYSGYYASSEPYQKHKKEVAGILRNSAQGKPHQEFLIGIADAIEKA